MPVEALTWLAVWSISSRRPPGQGGNQPLPLEVRLDAVGEVTTLVDRGFRGMARTHQHWHAPIGDRRTKAQRTDAERADNRDQAGLRTLAEQSIAHLANAWSLRRWRGLLYRVRQVFHAVAAPVSLGRWLHRIPT